MTYLKEFEEILLVIFKEDIIYLYLLLFIEMK